MLLLSLSMPSGAEFAALFSIFLVILGIALIPMIFFLLTLQNTLKAVSPQNRKMPPGQVWLLLIPLFNYVWNFIVVSRISESIELECKSRNLSSPPKPTYNIGIAYAILVCCGFIPVINIFSGIAALICWIIYWVKVNEFKTIFNQNATQHFS